MKPNTIYDPRWKQLGLADKEFFVPSELTSLYVNHPQFDEVWKLYKEFLRVREEYQKPYNQEKNELEQKKAQKEQELFALQQKLQNIEEVLASLSANDSLSLAVKTLLESAREETKQKIQFLQLKIDVLSSQIQELSSKIETITQRYKELHMTLEQRIAELGGTWEG